MEELQEIDIICLSETWLTEADDQLYNIPNYTSVSSYRSTRCGGTSIYIKKPIKFKERQDIKDKLWEDSSFEVTIIEITSSPKDYLVASVYRSPNSSIPKFLNLLESLLYISTKEKKLLILTGDFNIDTLKTDDSNSQDFINALSTSNFENLINLPTRVSPSSSTSIDKIIINDSTVVNSVGVIELDISDHFAVIVDITLSPHKENHIQTITSYRRVKTKSSIIEFHNLISKEKWTATYNESETEKKYNAFINTFVKHMNTSFPTKAVKTTINKSNPWHNYELKRLNNLKSSLYTLSKSHPQINLAYSRSKSLYNKMVNYYKRSYYHNLFHKNRSDPKKTWRTLNNLTGRHKTNIEKSFTIQTPEKLITDTQEAVNHINNFFSTIGTTLHQSHQFNPIPPLNTPNSHSGSFMLTYITEEDITNSIQSLKSNSAPGYDDITVDLLKATSAHITPPLLNIFNSSFDNGIFPSRMKVAKITPIHKKGNRQDPNNYRPISLLPSLSKCLEKIMFNKLTSYLSRFNIISDSQYGFTKNKSTVDAIVAFMDKISLHPPRQHIISIFCDLSKAFDCVSHEILLSKLEHIGIRGLALKWFKSYLSNRSQFTSITKPSNNSQSHNITLNNIRSTLASVNCGVPQGSILGPLLFNIYINDLPQIDNNAANYILYADDTNIMFSSDDPYSLFQKLNNVLSTSISWFDRNHLTLNMDKTTYMYIKPRADILAFQPPPNIINRTEETKFLGVFFTQDLTWKNHINKVINKIKPGIAKLYKLKNSLPTQALLQIYFSLIHSHLNYAILIWGNSHHTLMTKLLRLQKKAIRIIAHKPPRSSCRPLFQKFKILTVTSLYILESSCHAKKALLKSNSSESSIQRTNMIHTHNTRQSNNIFIPNSSANYRQYNINYKSSIIYNKLPNYLKLITSTTKFKNLTKQFLLDKTVYTLQEL